MWKVLTLTGVLCLNSTVSASTTQTNSENVLIAEATKVVQSYYANLNSRNYQAAYALWFDQGRSSGKTFSSFRQGFANTLRTQVLVRTPGRVEGAAGSLYVTVPVEVRAVLRTGQHQRFVGQYVVRSSNLSAASGVPSRNWHLYTGTLKLAR